MKRRSRLLIAALAAVTAMTSAGCSGGSSDVVGAEAGSAGVNGTVRLYAYAVSKPGFAEVIPAFTSTEAGEGVEFQQSYGASGDQSRKVKDGAPADFVNFSVEPDMTRLVDAGIVAEDWNEDAYGGVPFGSVVTMVVREGNPEGIRDWDDLLRPGIEVITPNPFSSGSAKWNLLAPYAAKSDGGRDKQAGLDFIRELVEDHIRLQPKSSRQATEAFLQGAGDVLLSYENEALFIEKSGDPIEYVTPPQTFRIENPVAVVQNSPNLEKAAAFRDFLFTPEAQRLWAEAGFRPVDPGVAKEFANKFPQPETLYTIDDLGGWASVDRELFQQDIGAIAMIYGDATR